MKPWSTAFPTAHSETADLATNLRYSDQIAVLLGSVSSDVLPFVTGSGVFELVVYRYSHGEGYPSTGEHLIAWSSDGRWGVPASQPIVALAGA